MLLTCLLNRISLFISDLYPLVEQNLRIIEGEIIFETNSMVIILLDYILSILELHEVLI